jgi:hypothetical protein
LNKQIIGEQGPERRRGLTVCFGLATFARDAEYSSLFAFKNQYYLVFFVVIKNPGQKPEEFGLETGESEGLSAYRPLA